MVSTNTKVVALEFVALLAFLDRFVLLVGTGVVQNGVVVVIDGLELGVGVVTGTDRDVDVVVFEVLIVVESTGVCWTHQGKRHYYVRRKGGMCHSQLYEGTQSRARII